MTPRSPLWLCTLVCLACSATPLVPPPDAGSSDGGTALELELLDAHNAVRATATPAPSPALDPMHWCDACASTAQAYVDQCLWGHNPNLPSTMGENIFADTDTSTTATQVVESWAAESADYTWATNKCTVGKSCGHYTQIVWRASLGVGCGSRFCSTGSPFGGGTWLYWVCDYQPAGNIVGQKPY